MKEIANDRSPIASEIELIRHDTERGRNLFPRRLAQSLFSFQIRVRWLTDVHARSDFGLLQSKVLAPCSGQSGAVRGCSHDFIRDQSTFGAILGEVVYEAISATASNAAPCVVLSATDLTVCMPRLSDQVAQDRMRPDQPVSLVKPLLTGFIVEGNQRVFSTV